MASNTSRNPRTNLTAGGMAVNGAKAVADLAIVPGASQLIDGNIRSGVFYAIGGLAARAVLGPIGWLVLGADSFSTSVSGKHLYEHFFRVDVERARD